MSTEVKVPTLGESITEATLGQWLKKPGEAVKLDEPIASLETDKVAVEVLFRGLRWGYEQNARTSVWQQSGELFVNRLIDGRVICPTAC